MPGPSAGARPHTAACGKCLRDRMLGAAGSPDPVPDELIAAITEQIAAHCGHIRLKCHRLALGWTVGQAVAAVHAYCRDKGLHEVGLTDRSWKDWESGRAPSPDYQDLICRMMATGPVQLGFATDYSPPKVHQPAWSRAAAGARLEARTAGAADSLGPGAEVAETDRRKAVTLAGMAMLAPDVLADVLGHAAEEAFEFTRQAQASALGSGTLDHLEVAVSEMNAGYSAKPPHQVFGTALTYRRKVEQLLAGSHTLREGRELFAYAGWLSELLAWLTHDLGDPRAGAAFATDAYQHALEAEHGELAAWSMDAAASISLYQHRPDRALTAARHGLAHAPTDHPLAVRMHAQAARAHAASGNADGFASSLRAAQQAFDLLPARARPRFGTDVVPLAEFALTSYPASSCIWLGQAEAARGHAEQALEIFQAAPEGCRSPSREAIARIDLALAHAHLGSPDDACVLGTQALDSERVVDSVQARAADLASYLGRRYPRLGAAERFADQLAAVPAGTTNRSDNDEQ